MALSLTNATALLWRLNALGVDIGDRWRELAAGRQGHADGKCLAFCDIHAAMAELRSGREALVWQRLEAMRETAAAGSEAAGVYRTVGIPIVEGLAAFQRGAYAEAVELLLPVRFELWRMGGSHAQRGVIDWTLAEARWSAGRCGVAGARTLGDPSAQRAEPALPVPCRGHPGLIASVSPTCLSCWSADGRRRGSVSSSDDGGRDWD